MKKEIVNPKEYLLKKPQPLYSREHNLALFWSSKSGCTFAVKWFLYQVGLLEAALFYNQWVHHFREEVFYRSQQYRMHFDKILAHETRVVKIVRNPFLRVVSSYIHAVRTGYEDKEISLFLKRDIAKDKSYSFREFVDYLESLDLHSIDTNANHRVQLHPIEKEGILKPGYLVHLENSEEEIKSVELQLGLRSSHFTELKKSNHHSIRVESSVFCGDEKFCAREGQREKSFPEAKYFFDKIIKSKVATIYEVDFDAYGYDIDFIP